MKAIALLLVGIVICAAVGAQPARTAAIHIADGSGSFTLAGGGGREGKTIEVYYHKPRTFTVRSPVLMVVPGAGRNGWTYRDAWVSASEEHGVLILSPSYSEEHYPEFWSYNLAGMIADVDVSETPVSYRIVSDPDAWIFNDFDRLFLAVKEHLGLEASTYDAFGHSAGGQLLHRLALFHPGSRVNRVLAANSGWYTVPTFDDEFPYGLTDSALTPATIEAALAEDLVVFLGERDDENEVRGDLARTPEIDVQGVSRIERGKYFYDRAAQTAAELGVELKWKLEIVPDVGHDAERMSAAAADYLYRRL
jgi:pimeloyl-ACP methyl ester carboxylesterase